MNVIKLDRLVKYEKISKDTARKARAWRFSKFLGTAVDESDQLNSVGRKQIIRSSHIYCVDENGRSYAYELL